MIKIEHNNTYWIDETNIQAIELYFDNKLWRVNVTLINNNFLFCFESKEKANYFLDKYFKEMIE
jgi:hypothetical protein